MPVSEVSPFPTPGYPASLRYRQILMTSLEFDETRMVTCSDCEDYDLCLTCLLKDTHGHHPGHTFALIQDGKLYLKHLVLSRCRPGRHHPHAAVCDGCDKVGWYFQNP
jgi:next to BRCA1 gene 1 protein